MKYTFLMPAYKAAFFREAIQSILNQTYKDFLLIISDDCSPEGLKAIVDEFDDERIVYRRNETNIGAERLVDHWNLLLGLSDSEYVILAPDDDVYSPRFLEEIDKLCNLYPHCKVFKTRSQIIDGDGNVTRVEQEYPAKLSMLENAYSQIIEDNFFGIGNYVFRTDALKSVSGFYPLPLAWGTDVVANVVLSDNNIAITKDVLFSFRNSGENISSQKDGSFIIRKKNEATLLYCDAMEKIVSSIDPNSSREIDYRTRIFQRLQFMRVQSLHNSARFYSFPEIIRILKDNKNHFSSLYRKCAVLYHWMKNKINAMMSVVQLQMALISLGN